MQSHVAKWWKRLLITPDVARFNPTFFGWFCVIEQKLSLIVLVLFYVLYTTAVVREQFSDVSVFMLLSTILKSSLV